VRFLREPEPSPGAFSEFDESHPVGSAGVGVTSVPVRPFTVFLRIQLYASLRRPRSKLREALNVIRAKTGPVKKISPRNMNPPLPALLIPPI
jgi:hypothetical protein